MKNTLLENEHVSDVHHLHIWAISTTDNALTAHIVIDSLDAKLNEFQKFIMDDASASNWTNYNALLDRKLLK